MQDPPLEANSRKEVFPQKEEDPQTQGKKVENKENVQTLHFLHTTLHKLRGFIPNMEYSKKKERKMREQMLMITVNLCEKLADFFPLKIHDGILLSLICMGVCVFFFSSFSLDNNNINIFFRMFHPRAWQNARQLEVTQSENPLGCLEAA